MDIDGVVNFVELRRVGTVRKTAYANLCQCLALSSVA